VTWQHVACVHTGTVNSPMNPVSGVQAARHRNDPDVVRRLLATPGRWAVVGLSQNRARVAYRIAAYLQELGMEIVPVHPRAEAAYGVAGYRTLADVPGPIDVVDVFVRSELAGDVVDQAIAVGARAVWLQLGVIDEAAGGPAPAPPQQVLK
jgi:predicted CoA-binding protein